MPAPVLRVVRGAGAGREIALQDELVIGREAGGDGRLDGEPALSRRHARITRGADGALTIEDLGSLNGTSVNGERIAAATPLRRGDQITLGATVLQVADPGDPLPSTARTYNTVLADVPARPPRRPRTRASPGPSRRRPRRRPRRGRIAGPRRPRVRACYRGSRAGGGEVRAGSLRASAGKIAGGRARATLDPADPRLVGLILHTARRGPGAAGGPLVDDGGKVVGLNLLPPDRGPIAGALPIERAKRVYANLATGATKDVGLRLEPWSEIRRGVGGLLVTGVDPGGAGRRASLSGRARRSARRPANPLLGATIFAVNGATVRNAADVCRALAGVRRGARVRIRADIRSPRPSPRRSVIMRVRA